jgi:hypothetical protein
MSCKKSYKPSCRYIPLKTTTTKKNQDPDQIKLRNDQNQEALGKQVYMKHQMKYNRPVNLKSRNLHNRKCEGQTERDDQIRSM